MERRLFIAATASLLACRTGEKIGPKAENAKVKSARPCQDGFYVIAEPCIGTKDTACVDACPVDCIHPKKDEAGFATAKMLFIDPVECIACTACVPVCPKSAIFSVKDLPGKWKQYEKINADHYKPCG